MRTTGGNRTRDLHFRQKVALSTELQRYAERKIVLISKSNLKMFKLVDNSDIFLQRQKVAFLSTAENPVSNGGVFAFQALRDRDRSTFSVIVGSQT